MKERIVKLVTQSNCMEDVKIGLELLKGYTIGDIPAIFSTAFTRPNGIEGYSVPIELKNTRHYAIKLSNTLYAHVGIRSIYFTKTPYNLKYHE